jgi:tetratricopeptide (TPR) repeat protein
MTGEQWVAVRRLLDEVLDNPDTRPEMLAALRQRDPETCDELERLLAEVEREQEQGEESEPAASDMGGQTVGPYTIVREIGRGGAGTVYLASREEAGARVETALKFLRTDFLRGAPRRTFQRELRALARLNHPHIARLLDWGSIPGGLLYLAIEYVDGQSITRYCAQERLRLADRLALFEQACEAVEHAHRNLVVHRDLKPSNILVAGGGQVKLLDFGIAAELDSAAETTTLAQRALTPAYASPEQIEGRPVTVATDVYSLGLVLYELLAGQLPHSKDADQFWATLNEEPDPPSRRAILGEVSAREIAGDLDKIVLQAIHKDPERRFLSVELFAADIRRFREGRPVLARRGSRLYVLGRFLRRNRLNVAAASLAVFALAATAGVAVWKWRAADRNLAEAQRDYHELRAFARTVISNIDAETAASPTQAQRRISETITKYLDQLSKGRQDDEELQLQIADAYVQLGLAQGQLTHPNQGDPASALRNFEQAYQISLRQWRTKASRNSGIELLHAALEAALARPDPAPAAAFLSSGIGTAQELLFRFPKDEEVLRTFSGAYGVLAQRLRAAGDLPGAIEDFQKAIGFADRALAEKPDYVGALSSKEGYTGELGNTLRLEGRFEEALADQTRAGQLARQVAELHPANHTRREEAFKLLGRCEALRGLKKYAEAQRDAHDALAELTAIASQDPGDDQAKADVSLAWFRLGNVQFSEGRIADATVSFRESLRLREELYERHRASLQASQNYERGLIRFAEVLLAARQDSAAEGKVDVALALSADILKQAPTEVYAAADLAKLYRAKATCVERSGRRLEAAGWLRQSLQMWHEICQRSPLDVGLAAAARECARALARFEAGT